MSTFSHDFKKSIFLGIKKGVSSYLWMLKILIPVSFLTMIFVYSGLMNHIDFLLQPAMAILSLPPEAALPLLVGVFTGPSACIASMAALSLSTEHMTLIAIFVLISHALIQEGIIQSKSGLPIFMATFIRLTASVLTVIVVAWFLPTGQSAAGVANELTINQVSFMALLGAWCVDTLLLCAKILAIIMPLMCILEIMKQFNLIDHFVKPLTPLLRILGLDKKVGMLWLTAVIFGLLYGAAVIVEAAKKGNFTREELHQLQVSIGINHSMLEDPALFLSLGLGPLWLWVPRLLAAIIAVYALKIFCRIKSSIGTSAISIKNEQ